MVMVTPSLIVTYTCDMQRHCDMNFDKVSNNDAIRKMVHPISPEEPHFDRVQANDTVIL